MGKPKWASFILIPILLVSLCLVSIESPVQAASSGDDWPMFRHDPAHTGYSGSSVPATVPVVLWTSPKGLGGSPVVADGYVYILDQNYLRCINASTGNEIWKSRDNLGASDSSPAIYEGYIYTPVNAYNASTGELFLNYTDYDGYTSPTVVEGIIYIGSPFHNSFFALNAATGIKIWNFTTVGKVASSPAVADGRVYFSSTYGNVYGFNALSGAKIWSYQTSGSLGESSPVVVGGRVYVGSSENVYCLDALTGAKIWNNSKTDRTAWSSPAVANGYVYIGSMDGNIYALNASTGAQIWNATGGGSSSPSVADEIVYIGDSYKILAFNASTGTQIWNYTFPEPEYYMPSSPAIVNGVVFAGNYLELYAFGAPPATPSPPPPQEPPPSSTQEPPPSSQETFPTTWDVQVVDLWGSGGSITFDSHDNPHISYYVGSFSTTTRTGLHYAVWTGINWSTQTVDPSGGGGVLALDSDDNPHILYKNTSGDLKYAVWTGANWTIQTIDSSDDNGRYRDMTLDSNDNPHIVYSHFDSDHNYNLVDNTYTMDLRYAVWTGSNWTIQTVDTPFTDVRNLNPSIVLDSNNYPRILYNEAVWFTFDYKDSPNKKIYVTHDLKYAAWNGSGWLFQTVGHNASSTVGSIGNVVLDSKGHPHLSYIHEDFTYNSEYGTFGLNNSLNYAYWDGSTWNVQFVDSKPRLATSKNPYLSLDSSDKPHIHFFTEESVTDFPGIHYNLLHAKWTGSTWNVETVDSDLANVRRVVLDAHGRLHLLFDEPVGTIRGAWKRGRLKYGTFIGDTPTELLTTWIVVPVIIVTVVGVGLVIYFKKRKR